MGQACRRMILSGNDSFLVVHPNFVMSDYQKLTLDSSAYKSQQRDYKTVDFWSELAAAFDKQHLLVDFVCSPLCGAKFCNAWKITSYTRVAIVWLAITGKFPTIFAMFTHYASFRLQLAHHFNY